MTRFLGAKGRTAVAGLLLAGTAWAVVSDATASPARAGTSTPTWNQLSPPTSLSVRSSASMAYDAATGQTILFGGRSAGGGSLADTWDWNGTTWTELFPTTNPPASQAATMAYDPETSQLILFGGSGLTVAALNDTWDWNGTNWIELSPATSPTPRFEASMSYDVTTGKVVLFGGYNDNPKQIAFTDTWTWNGQTWKKLPHTGPKTGFGTEMTFDASTQQLLLFGGSGGNRYSNATWILTGNTWSVQHPSSKPSVRGGTTMDYDPAISQVVLFAGANNNKFLNDTWTWDGSTWTRQSPTASPPARSAASMVFDSAANQLLVFGGQQLGGGGNELNDTWTYQP